MKLLTWNCRGLDNPRAVQVLLELTRKFKPEVVFLSETLVDKKKLESIGKRISYSNVFGVERMRRGGGLNVFWTTSCNLMVQSFFRNHVDMKLEFETGSVCILTGFYGNSNKSRRRESWQILKLSSRGRQDSWAVISDFNDILYAKKKKRRRSYSLKYIDVSFSGYIGGMSTDGAVISWI